MYNWIAQVTGKRTQIERKWLWGAAILSMALMLAVVTSFVVRHTKPGPPIIKAVSPTLDTSHVSGTTAVKVSFDRPFPAAFDAINLRLWDQFGNRIIGAFEVHSSETSVMLVPNSPLEPGQYQAEVQVVDSEPYRWQFTVAPSTVPVSPKGGSLLVVNSQTATFSEFYPEILRAEGFTRFTTIDAEDLTKEVLFSHDVVILPGGALSTDQISAVKEWLEAGGNLISVRPMGRLANLAGLQQVGPALNGGYLKLNTSLPPGRGLVAETIQFHGDADVFTTAKDSSTIATLYRGSSNTVQHPALTLRPIGQKGGEIAAFTFDVAQSVVLTRQGNPGWAGQERDGADPIRPNDLFFGIADVEPNFLDIEKLKIPQADETMRLLSNLIIHMMRDKTPMPRFAYFPNGAKAVLVMAADDHGTKHGTKRFFERMHALWPDKCDVASWDCPRATSWMYTSVGLTDTEAAYFIEQGFDVGSHVDTHCQNWSGHSLNRMFFEGLHEFELRFPSAPAQQGSRLHCIAWSDYTTQPAIERGWGIRYDMNYYQWPKAWTGDQVGFMTGSGLPMRFSSEHGQLIDVYQQETHLVDEGFSGSTKEIEGLIDRALGPEGYYAAFGTHFDFRNDFDAHLMQLATNKGVPMVSVQQMLDWTDGRSASTFDDVRWTDNVLTFTVEADPRTGKGLEGMLPLTFAGASLLSIHRGNEAVPVASETIKGFDYGLFSAVSGTYTATYWPK